MAQGQRVRGSLHRLLPVCQALGEPMIQAGQLKIQTCLGVDGGFVVLIGTTGNSYVDESVDGSPLHLLMIDVQLLVFPFILVLILLISVLFVLVLVGVACFLCFLLCVVVMLLLSRNHGGSERAQGVGRGNFGRKGSEEREARGLRTQTRN